MKLRSQMAWAVVCVLAASSGACAADLRLEKDDMKITKDARIAPGEYRLRDAKDDGAVRIEGDGLTVDFQGATLDGSAPGQEPDQFTGTGVMIRGRDITVKNAKVRGYKVAIYAKECPGLVIEDVDVSGNWQKHLLSTPEAEDGSDWLFPHNNDNHEWMTNYGAGLYVERSDKVTIRRVRARHGQNGILIDRVTNSKIYDNDCSFLSGWGLAMWRSSHNVISRNAFDFCVRGYSHGVYNRGQDSAGILMFEQNNDNVIAENSATHGGDGVFGFAGREAIGEAPAPSPDFSYKRRGNDDNLLINNDFSYAPAHGIEMTFSFGNKFIGNRLVGNAICGVWGGYSQDTLIAGNTFEENGEMGYGLERGGVNIEHGSGNVIEFNTFRKNKCGVHLWWSRNEAFEKGPWGKANDTRSTHNAIRYNTFEGDTVGLHIRETTDTEFVSNRMVDVKTEIMADDKSKVEPVFKVVPKWAPPKDYPVYGETHPVGARKHLYGRQHILMTEWGPYDYSEYAVFPVTIAAAEKATFQVLGQSGRYKVTKVDGEVGVSPMEGDVPALVTIKAPGPGMHEFAIQVETSGKTFTVRGSLFVVEWDVSFFAWDDSQDPREHEDAWKKLLAGKPIDQRKVTAIDFKWGGGALGPNLPSDKFGTLATATVKVPKGKYRVWTVSDDGIRVWIDGKKVLEDWTWHPPKEIAAEVDLAAGEHKVRIEHFEIDGFAQLQFRLEPLH